MPTETPGAENSSSALTQAGSYCSVVAFVAVIVLQSFEFGNWMVLFWWIVTALIALAAISACFTPPSILLRGVFAFVFVAQLPAFNRQWRDVELETIPDIKFEVGFGDPKKLTEEDLKRMEIEQKTREEFATEKKRLEAENKKLENENLHLHVKWRETLLFWEGIAHLTGMGFALLGCTAGGQRRIRIIYEGS